MTGDVVVVGLSITLPNQMADALRERVQSGQYASESEAIRDGLRALFAQEAAVETWLRDEVAAARDARSRRSPVGPFVGPNVAVRGPTEPDAIIVCGIGFG